MKSVSLFILFETINKDKSISTVIRGKIDIYFQFNSLYDYLLAVILLLLIHQSRRYMLLSSS